MCHFAQFKDKRLRIGRSRLKYGDRPGEAFLHVVPGIDERNLGRALFLPEICRNGKSDGSIHLIDRDVSNPWGRIRIR